MLHERKAVLDTYAYNLHKWWSTMDLSCTLVDSNAINAFIKF